MSEAKRVSFMTIDTADDFPKKSEKESVGGKKKTFRVEVEIFEPDEYKFPDYNYKKLLFIEKVSFFLLFESVRCGDMIESRGKRRRTICKCLVALYMLCKKISMVDDDF